MLSIATCKALFPRSFQKNVESTLAIIVFCQLLPIDFAKSILQKAFIFLRGLQIIKTSNWGIMVRNAKINKKEAPRMTKSIVDAHSSRQFVRTIKIFGNSQKLVGFFFLQTTLLDKVRLAIENIVGPAIASLRDKLEFFLQIRNGLRIVLLQTVEFRLELGLFGGKFAQSCQFLGPFAVVVFPASLGVGQTGLGFFDLDFGAFDRFERLFVLDLQQTVLLGGETPKIIAPTNFGLVDKAIVHQFVVDVGNSVFVCLFVSWSVAKAASMETQQKKPNKNLRLGSHSLLGCQHQDFFLRKDRLCFVVNAKDSVTLFFLGHALGSSCHDENSLLCFAVLIDRYCWLIV